MRARPPDHVMDPSWEFTFDRGKCRRREVLGGGRCAANRTGDVVLVTGRPVAVQSAMEQHFVTRRAEGRVPHVVQPSTGVALQDRYRRFADMKDPIRIYASTSRWPIVVVQGEKICSQIVV